MIVFCIMPEDLSGDNWWSQGVPASILPVPEKQRALVFMDEVQSGELLDGGTVGCRPAPTVLNDGA